LVWAVAGKVIPAWELAIAGLTEVNNPDLEKQSLKGQAEALQG
jgi:hypothetical protein